VSFLNYFIRNATERAEGRPLSTPPFKIPAKTELMVIHKLDAMPHIMMYLALTNSAEYEAVAEGDVSRGRQVLLNDPTPSKGVEIDSARVTDYYYTATLQQWTEGHTLAPADNAHILPAVRAQIALSALELKVAEELPPDLILQSGMRLNGIVYGQLMGIQAKLCARTGSDAARRAVEFIKDIKIAALQL
jgi:hypothetical protein